MPIQLKFRDDGTFTIVQFTDIHWHNGEPEDIKSRALMGLVVEKEAPDLVALTGDILSGSGCKDPRKSFRQVVEAFEERQVPWAAVFGNHDDEGGVSRAELMEVQTLYALSVSEPGPDDRRVHRPHPAPRGLRAHYGSGGGDRLPVWSRRRTVCGLRTPYHGRDHYQRERRSGCGA